MLRLTNKVTIGSFILAGVVSVEIESGWEMLTDTCKITLPAKIRHQGKFVNLAESRLINKGDSVKVELGYDDDNEVLFEGFVDNIEAGSPVTVLCQDWMWLLKREPQNLSYKEVTLKQLLKDTLPSGVELQAVDVSLGQFRLTKATAAMALEELKKAYYLHSWFRGNKLYAGLAYWPETSKTHTFRFQTNIIDDGTELTFKSAEETKIKVRAVSMKPDNSKIELELGDPEGEERTLHFYNLEKADLEKAANEEITRLRYDGYSGSFLTFGKPTVQHGDVVVIQDPQYGREGRYFVKQVQTAFGGSGYRQTIHLDRKA